MNRKKITVYVTGGAFPSLKEISERTGIPVSRLIDQAVDDYFQAIGWQDGSLVQPIDKEYIKQHLRSKTSR